VQRDLAVLMTFLARVRRRVVLRAAIDGASAGAGLAVVLAIIGWPDRDNATWKIAAFVVAILVGCLIALVLTTNRRRRVALLVERRAPASRNLIVTAAELSATEPRGYVPELVFANAAKLVNAMDPAALVPTLRSAILAGAVFATWLLVSARSTPISESLRGASTVGASGAPVISGVDVTVAPPAYTGRATETLHDPQRVTALAGSKLSVVVRAAGDLATVETVASQDTLVKRGTTFVGQIVVDADGYLAVQARRGERNSARRLIGLTVLPDSLPHVRIVAPGRDERFPDAHRTLSLSVEATDDIGLASLVLRFTKVAGSGERFTFVEGQVPLTITKSGDRAWTARAVWPLDSLKLDPGDMVVYRAVAADRRQAGGTAESDSYIAEILAPGGVAAPGFAADIEQERYAVSQQMVIVKTERLIARRASMSPESFADESAQLAAEQRKVRAEFVFMLGGELADAPDVAASMTDINEEAEATGESDILAGYNANAGHVALIRGIRAMSRAAASLTTVDPSGALPQERVALDQLERAFSHSRILLRALATREKLDAARRLTGSLTDAASETRPTAEPAQTAATVTLRRVLSDLSTLPLLLGLANVSGDSAARHATELAERALRIDPSSPSLQDVSAQLSRAATAIAAHHVDEASASLDQASRGIVRILRSELLQAPGAATNLGDRRMQGALVDALRASKP
jgi:hypothetical protein